MAESETPYVTGLRDGAHKAAAVIKACAEKCEREDKVMDADALHAVAETILLHRDDTGKGQA